MSKIKKVKTVKTGIDKMMLLAIIGLVVIGIIMVYSSSYFTFAYETNEPNQLLKKELAFAIAGLIAMYIVSLFDSGTIRKLALHINITTVLMYIALVTPLGREIRGGLRWISLGGQTIMPSEFAKYAAVISLAYVLTAKKEEKNKAAYRFLVACPFIYIIGTLAQPDLSSAMVIVVAIMAVLFYAGLETFWIVLMLSSGLGLGILMIIIEPFRITRVKVMLDPFLDPTGKGFQVVQSLYAIASGGLGGKGLGNGIQKMMYLPFAYNDYIFSIYAEELGFVGCLLLLLALSVLILRGLKIAANAPGKFSLLVAGGIITLISAQALVNLYVSVSLIPSTGIPFPIISYGGTSLVTTLAALGLVLGISRQEIEKLPRAFEKIEKKEYHSLERRIKNK